MGRLFLRVTKLGAIDLQEKNDLQKRFSQRQYYTQLYLSLAYFKTFARSDWESSKQGISIFGQADIGLFNIQRVINIFEHLLGVLSKEVDFQSRKMSDSNKRKILSKIFYVI